MSNKKTAIVEVKVNDRRLTIEEYHDFIDCVSNVVVFDNELHLENLEPVFAITTLNLFTETPLIKKEEDDTKIDFNANYDFCINNGVLGQVKNVVGEDYIDRLYQDCLDTIEFNKSMAINRASSVSDKIVLGVMELIDTAKNAIGKFDVSQYTDVIKLAKDMVGKKITNESLSKAAIKNIVRDLPKNDVKKVDNITPIEG